MICVIVFFLCLTENELIMIYLTISLIQQSYFIYGDTVVRKANWLAQGQRGFSSFQMMMMMEKAETRKRRRRRRRKGKCTWCNTSSFHLGIYLRWFFWEWSQIHPDPSIWSFARFLLIMKKVTCIGRNIPPHCERTEANQFREWTYGLSCLEIWILYQHDTHRSCVLQDLKWHPQAPNTKFFPPWKPPIQVCHVYQDTGIFQSHFCIFDICYFLYHRELWQVPSAVPGTLYMVRKCFFPLGCYTVDSSRGNSFCCSDHLVSSVHSSHVCFLISFTTSFSHGPHNKLSKQAGQAHVFLVVK